ncbi:hypothetical protein CNR22_19590 [Sphingobacteriaceae bacterium]|nr:hypothetical protein CNR22_19590 [Sphingobacteriaceae bacterium]
MKNKSDLITAKDIASLKTKAAKVLFTPILSPLELTALNKKWQPFTYKIADLKIYISALHCKHLLISTLHKLQRLNAAVTKDKLSQGIPIKLRETFDDPKIVLSLIPPLRNKLCKLECYTLFSIMQKGKAFFEQHKFSAANIAALENLFMKYSCSKLFK